MARRTDHHHVRSVVTKDHAGGEIVHAWGPGAFSDTPDDLPPFPFPLYITSETAGIVPDRAFAEGFARFVQSSGGISDGNDHTRFELYTEKQQTLLDCVAHARKERRFRLENRIWPSAWLPRIGPAITDDGDKTFIVVIDRINWQQDGIVLVWYDPRVYELGESYVYWSSPLGDRPLVQAVLHRDMSRLTGVFGHLWGAWNCAGGSRAQELLWKTNKLLIFVAPNVTSELRDRFGKTSEALEGEEECSDRGIEFSHGDDEDDDDGSDEDDDAHHDLIVANRRWIQEEAEADEEDRAPQIVSSFDEDELWGQTEYNNMCTDRYYNIAGSEVLSVWNKKHGNSRPVFSVTIYVARDCPAFTPHGIFRCLDKGFLSASAWTLDIVYGIADVESALRMHNAESSRRGGSNFGPRKHTMCMLLDRIVGSVLPPELYRRIEDLLVPPPLPDYSGLPGRTYRNMFLFLSDGIPSRGPVIVRSNPAPLECDMAPVHSVLSESKPSYGSMGYEMWLQEVFEVIHLRYWHRVANEIHIIWSRAAPRAVLEEPLPTMRLRIGSSCHTVVASDNLIDDSEMTAELTLEASQPITVHKSPLFNVQPFHNTLELVDLTCSKTLPKIPISFKGARHDSSWDRSSHLGARRDDTPRSAEESRHFLTLTPGVTQLFLHLYTIVDYPLSVWLSSYHHAGLLLDGHDYALRQCKQDHLTIPRWTWGHWGDLKGPFNMPPMSVSMGEEWKFKFRCRSAENQSFFVCRCHQ